MGNIIAHICVQRCQFFGNLSSLITANIRGHTHDEDFTQFVFENSALNMIFNVMYYLELCNAVIISCTSHYKPIIA